MKRKDIERMLKESRELIPDAALRQRILDQKVPAADTAYVARSASVRTSHTRMAWRMIPIAAVLLLVMTVTLTGVGLYSTEYETVYIDINPSVELSVNRFERVIDVTYLNADAEDCFDTLALTNKGIERSIELIVDALDQDGYLEAQDTLYIGVSGKGTSQTEKLLKKVSECAERAQANKGYAVEVRGASITNEEKQAAKDMGVSPNKYRMIEEIISDDPTFDPNDLKDMKMKELRELIGESGKNKEKNTGNEAEGKGHFADEKDKKGKDEKEKDNQREIPPETEKGKSDGKNAGKADGANQKNENKSESDKATGKDKKTNS